MELHPPVKRLRAIETDHKNCIFCEARLPDKGEEIVTNPVLEGLKVIFEAAALRKDAVYYRLLPHKEDIISGKFNVMYHRSCRATYTSKTNLKHVDNVAESKSLYSSSSMGSHLKRSDTSKFNVKCDCFICGKSWKKGEKLIQIARGNGSSTREKVLAAALQRKDQTVQLNIINCEDLYAVEAKYHRSCYAAYISPRNISAAKRKLELPGNDQSIYDLVFKELATEIEETVLSQRKTVTTLSQVTSNFIKKLSDRGVHDKVYSWKLKKKLSQFFKTDLVFIERPGKSDLVCSSHVTVGDALEKASHLQEIQIESMHQIHELAPDSNLLDEKQILHSAVTILRNQIASIKDSGQFYDPTSQIAIEPCATFVPNILYNFIMWLTNGKSHIQARTCEDADVKKDDLSIISICHSIISASRKIRTPITLGLGIYINHEFGSKQLIEHLHALGHCISYDEVRHFLTSAALDQQRDDIYIPRGLECPSNTSMLIDAAIDNFDQNECTLDGKSSTHAMAAVVYQRSGSKSVQEAPKLRRSSEKSLRSDFNEEVPRYHKPPERPQPACTSDDFTLECDNTSACYLDAIKKDLLWKILRYESQGTDVQCIPAWAGFNSAVRKCHLPVANVRYLPFIQAPPSDISTIYAILLKLVQLAEKMGQQHILVTADMVIYSKAQELLWAHPPILDGKITMRIGGMHLTMAFIASLGTLFGDGGLLSLLTESGVYAGDTARRMLQGKQYARGVRGIKLVHEALYRMLFEAMERHIRKQELDWNTNEFSRALQELQDAFSTRDVKSAIHFSNEIENKHLATLENIVEDFRRNGREKSETFKYWDNFLVGGDILLHLLRAEREGNFQLHLKAVKETIPWFWAARRNTYAKYVPTYLFDMKQLEESHPQSYRHMCDGGFVIRRSSNCNFNAVASDQALEQSVNRDGKSKGGVIGLTRRKGALSRWLKTRHVTAEYHESVRSLCNSNFKVATVHEELGTSRMKRDEDDVCRIVEAANLNQNPFDMESVPSCLINITTGQVASEEVRKSMRTFLEEGQKKTREFVRKRMTKTTKSKSFWDSEPNMKIATFSSMRKSMTPKKTNKYSLDSEVLFRRLLVVSRQREISLESILKHELAAVPPSLFYDDGSMRKTTKADLAKKIEATCDEMFDLPSDQTSSYIIDGMALLQSLNETNFNTFDDIGWQVLRFIKSKLNGNLNVMAVALVFDRYENKSSIKQMERQRRGEETGAIFDIKGSRVVPNYRKLLKNSQNKTALANFVSLYLESNARDTLNGEQCIVLSGGYTESHLAKILTKTNISALPVLYSTQEEADSRIILHAIHFSKSSKRVIIKSDDTDVLVLALYYASKGMIASDVFMHAGHTTQVTNRRRFIPASIIAKNLGPDICQSLPAMHALTGCDTTSSFYKVGKSTAYSKLVEYLKKSPGAFKGFGISNGLQEDIVIARAYLLHVYGKRGENCQTLDRLRYVLASTTDKTAAELPPTEDAFEQHVMRARYQVAIWCQSHTSNQNLWNPTGNGWTQMEDGYLAPVMCTREIAPAEVRHLTHLYCTEKSCTIPNRCQCLNFGLKCTEFCACENGCKNTVFTDEIDSDEDDSGI